MKRNVQTRAKVLKIGITGGIGSGKTTVCRMFEELGIPVYYSDDRAKYLMQHEHYLIDLIKKNFGEDVYEDGKLNRQLLASRVFHDKEKVALLNSLVHPAVFRDTERWVMEQQATEVPYALKEAALLVEAGSHKYLDKLIVITAPLTVRLKRVVERDKVDSTDVMARMKNQLPEEDKVKLADFVIANDSDTEHLRQQVQKIHQQLVELSAIK
jgi:dephospho-CoA kinase